MNIFIDADALPGTLRPILFRAAERMKIQLIFVANQTMKLPDSPYISFELVPSGLDVADDWIAEKVAPGDLVITADIPLADRVISNGGHAINPRGQLYTQANIKQRLAMRDLMDGLRSVGEVTGGPATFSARNREDFANQLSKFLAKHCRDGN